jgi:hypothetical protein
MHAYTLAYLLLLGSLPTHGASPYDSLHSDQQKTFTWFDTLGFPDVKGRPFVRVGTGCWSQSGQNPRENQYIKTFLLKEETNTFTVLGLDLRTQTFHARNASGEFERVFFEPANLAEEADARVTKLRQPSGEEDRWPGFGRMMPERTEVFILSWACARNGLLTVSSNLYAQATTMKGLNGHLDGPAGPTTMIEVLEKDIGHALMWRAILAFGDPSISRKELMAMFDNLVARYPASEHRKRAMETADLLKTMISEDDAHARQEPKPWETMSRDEQAVELVFQLRDQNGHQWSQPGWCDIFEGSRSDQTNSPAHQLAAMGHDAVPRLIAALDDRRFTRSVGYHRDFRFSHRVLTVSDCAQTILERIAARQFHASQAGSVGEKMQEWWNEIQKKGEKQCLIEGAEKGDRDAISQARQLKEKYPDALLGAVSNGIRNTKRSWERCALIGLAGKIKGPEPVPLLLQELKDAPFLPARVAAAFELRARTNAAALPAMIDEWEKRPVCIGSFEEDGPGSLIEFLATCNDPGGIQALAEDLTSRPVDQRLQVITALGRSDSFMSSWSNGGGPVILAGDGVSITNRKAAAAIEELLVKALEDTEERTGLSGSWGEKSYANPRICDMAGHVLSLLWKDRYDFDLSASSRNRNAQRVACLNGWRARHGLPAVPPPPVRTVPPVPKEKTGPLLDKIRQAAKTGDVAPELKELETLSLPALPAIVDCLDGWPEPNPVRDELFSLARRLACQVAEIVIPETSVKPGDELTKAIQALNGWTLTSEGVVEILLMFAKTDMNGLAGIKLNAERNEDLSGVTLTVTWTTNKLIRKSSRNGWNGTTAIISDGEQTESSSSGSSYDYQQTPAAYKDLRKKIDKLLLTDPRKSFLISVSLSRDIS